MGKNPKKHSTKLHNTNNHSSNKVCDNCQKPGHTKIDCWAKGGGKEGQDPRLKNSKTTKKINTDSLKQPTRESAAVTNEDDLFAFSCTSDYVNAANDLGKDKARIDTIVDSGATWHFTLDKGKLINYQTIQNKLVTTANGSTFKAVGMGNLPVSLPNGKIQMNAILKRMIYVPELTFMLISISALDESNSEALFKGGMCTI
jgi:hypothetical protein